MIPQLIYLALAFLGVGIAISEHGKPKKGNNNAWVTFTAFVTTVILLYYGGFFNAMLL